MALATSFYAQRVASSVRSGAAIARVPTAGACCGYARDGSNTSSTSSSSMSSSSTPASRSFSAPCATPPATKNCAVPQLSTTGSSLLATLQHQRPEPVSSAAPALRHRPSHFSFNGPTVDLSRQAHQRDGARLFSSGRRDVDGDDDGPKLTETEFQTEADAALNACHDMIENSYWEEYVDDYDLSDGVLTIKLVNLPENYKNLKKATFVINKHNATKQIWYSSPCGAQYFDAPYEQALCEALETDLNELCQLDDSDDDEL